MRWGMSGFEEQEQTRPQYKGIRCDEIPPLLKCVLRRNTPPLLPYHTFYGLTSVVRIAVHQYILRGGTPVYMRKGLRQYTKRFFIASTFKGFTNILGFTCILNTFAGIFQGVHQYIRGVHQYTGFH